MHTHAIPPQQWQPFLQSFTQLHEGDPVEVEIVGPGRPTLKPAPARPLIGVVPLDECGSGACIEVVTGAPAEVTTHTLREPSHLLVTELDSGRSVSLEVAAEDGSVMLVHVKPIDRPRARPETYIG